MGIHIELHKYAESHMHLKVGFTNCIPSSVFIVLLYF